MRRKTLLPFILICLITCGCTSHKYAAREGMSNKTIRSETSISDSGEIEIPAEFKKPYVISHGLIFGIIGFFSIGYLSYTWGNGLKIGEKCDDCYHPELFWIGGSIGFIGGYILGTHMGSKIARIKYRNKSGKNMQNSDSTRSEYIFDKSKL